MTLHADVGHGVSFGARGYALEREAAELRDSIERVRSVAGDGSRAYARRLYEENETLNLLAEGLGISESRADELLDGVESDLAERRPA